VNESTARWTHRLALITAICAFAMLSVGGLVTSYKAGLAYLTWPSSDGHFFNPPGWLVERDTLVEHGHRLLGQLLGVLGLVQLVWFWLKEPRRSLKWLMTAAFVLGGLQAVLGGTRVLERSAFLAFLHGCTAQLFLGLVVAMAYLTSRDARSPRPGRRDPHLMRTAAVSALVLIGIQVVLGAQRRHLATTAALQAHILGAVMVLGGTGAAVALALLRHARERAILVPALLLGGLVVLQLGFGLAALLALRSYHGGFLTPPQALLPSLHQVVGAAIVCTAVVLALRVQVRCAPRVRAVEAAA